MVVPRRVLDHLGPSPPARDLCLHLSQKGGAAKSGPKFSAGRRARALSKKTVQFSPYKLGKKVAENSEKIEPR